MKRLTWRMSFVGGYRPPSNLGVLVAMSCSSCQPPRKVSPIRTPNALRTEVRTRIDPSAHFYNRCLANYARHKIVPL